MGGIFCCCFGYDGEEVVVPSAVINNQPYQRVNPQSQPPPSAATVELSQPVKGGGCIAVVPNSIGGGKEVHEAQVKEEHESSYAIMYVFEEDEDVCPTCLEEYTYENPRIVAKWSHEYHLSCIYEWMERSETCPICNKVMQFDEPN